MPKPKNIETPELLWDLFTEYVQFKKENPILVHDFVGKDGDSVQRKKERPLTIEGFECYLYDKGVIGDLSHYFANTGGKYEGYLTICSRIRKAVRNDQIEGGMAGIYNPSITQRLNGLVEKSQNENVNTNHNITVEVVNTNVPLANNEGQISQD
jgi:hypothetical protein